MIKVSLKFQSIIMKNIVAGISAKYYITCLLILTIAPGGGRVNSPFIDENMRAMQGYESCARLCGCQEVDLDLDPELLDFNINGLNHYTFVYLIIIFLICQPLWLPHPWHTGFRQIFAE